ncbi:putative Late nodulin [Medicago truncatula]|uniref:Nodule Cysteine-Rich (NCR) secreted peptide n=1 Tax=Medicago truncatula TaxID=3880 RepID=A0A072TFD7_MEDTR|nr:Nodule Cysteine-Rich (NCR) secreted peptide [Medicago truncatula]RHN67981.1 putative Late nodulin [Medicago truncatula]
MVEIVKFIYVMIIFFSLFLVVTKVDAVYWCFDNSDCPQHLCHELIIPRCKIGVCVCLP